MSANRQSTRQSFRLLSCGLAVVTLGTTALFGQTDTLRSDIDTPGLLIEASAGFDGAVDTSAPVPLSFLIKNDSNQIIEGRLTLSDPTTGNLATLDDLFVGPNSTRRLSSIQAMNRWIECIATLSDGNQILWRRELPLATGNSFDHTFNVALFIDRTRKLHIPSDGNAVPSAGGTIGNGMRLTGKEGWPVRCLNVRPWQVPDHAGPLQVAQAIILSENAAPADLNDKQWRAVANWICQGGTIFLHGESNEVINRLVNVAPLGQAPPVQSGPFRIRHVGLGAIYEYTQSLLSSAGSETVTSIGKTTGRLKKIASNTTFTQNIDHYNRGGQPNVNRMLVLVFFLFYALFSGVGALLLFRLNQRKLAIYTITIVLAASVFSGLLGGYLRSSCGDLNWVTVTESGAGGAVQTARIDVRSAGGRSKQVAIQGSGADLQVIEETPRYRYSWNQFQTATYQPFTWQANLAQNVPATYQINVPTTPWGKRRLKGTAYHKQLGRLKFALALDSARFGPVALERQLGAPTIQQGRFSLKLVNQLGVGLSDCRLMIGITCDSPQNVGTRMIDAYHIQAIPSIAAGATMEQTIQAQFQANDNSWYQFHSWANGWLAAPKIPRLGSASAWIVGRLQHSPGMTIDEQRSDFTPGEGRHLFVQEILPEEMPDVSIFFDEKKTDGKTEDGVEGQSPDAKPPQ